MATLRILSLLGALVMTTAPHAAQQLVPAEAGITGVVRAPDGSPVTHGSVTLTTTATNLVTAAVDRTGHFRVVPDSPGRQRLFIAVPGFAPHRLHLTVPSSRIIALPDITLSEATYFRARFVTAEGEPLGANGLRRQSFDSEGVAIPDPLGHAREQIDADGSITIGPLTPGRMLLAFDRPPYAQTRLRDVDVNGTKPLIDGGVITIGPGALLHVDILNGDGTPVPRHEVWIEDAVRPTPLSFAALRTDDKGHAVFDRLAAGRYRVWTRTAERCGNQQLTISRLVSTPSLGEARMRLVIGGRARFRITTPLGPLPGRGVYLSPDSSSEPPWQTRVADDAGRRPAIPALSPSSCRSITDSDGRFSMEPFPPGPSQLRVVMFNSTYVARVTVPEGDREMAVAVPDGLLPVRVTNQSTREAIGGAQVAWVGGGGRVEALATPNGDVLLEGVGATGGTLMIRAREHQTLEGGFDETPGTMQEVALTPVPGSRLTLRIVDGKNDALAGAVVGLLARDSRDAAEFVVADSKGIAAFTEVPAGNLQFTAHAVGFEPATARVPEDRRASIVITMTRIP